MNEKSAREASRSRHRLPPVGVDHLEKSAQGFDPGIAAPAISDALRRQCSERRIDPCSALIREDELAAIRSRRSRYGLDETDGSDLAGLAFSGGGIRSATFALGVLQALARYDLLKRFDLLSTVSGGGYIGTSLLWWLTDLSGRRFGLGPESFPYGTDDPSATRDRAGLDERSKLLRNLKEKGNYLTPGGGINFLSLLAVVLRGVTINLFFWIPLLTLLLCGFVLWDGLGYTAAMVVAGGLILVFATASIIYSLATGFPGLTRATAYRMRRSIEQRAGLLLAIAIGSALLASLPLVHEGIAGGAAEDVAKEMLGGLLASLAGLATGIVTFLRTSRRAVEDVRRLPGVTTNLIASLSAGLLVYGVLLLCHGLASVVTEYWAEPWLKTLVIAVLVVAFAAAVVVNLNHISAHRMYRDRLMEAFMPDFAEALVGASQVAPAAADRMRLHQVDEANGPFPIINTNLVLVQARDRRRRIRGGDNFILTPRYCGSNATGWVDCRELMDDRMTLPTAMATSGAAANPNTGAAGVGLTRNRLVSVLMALLNLRLGYWIPNYARNRPPGWLPNHVIPGLGAITPWSHHEEHWFLELSDGGHFENLGLYELVRRRTRLIVLSDAAQDEDFRFADLQVAQRRIAADFGATLDLEPEALEPLIPTKSEHRFPERELELAERGHVVGRIRYADGSPGVLIYLKSTLIDHLPLALLGYRGANPTFPDQSTGDQFFDEEQFESYRELGFLIARRMLDDPEVRRELNRLGFDLSRLPAFSQSGETTGEQ